MKLPVLLLLIPLAFAVLHTVTGKYPFSALVTLSCALCVGFAAWRAEFAGLTLAAYAFSVAGDYFMAHSGGKNGDRMLLFGIGGFFLAHLCFLIYGVLRSVLLSPANSLPGAFLPFCALLSCSLILGYAAFLGKVLYPAIGDRTLKVAVTAYTGISLATMTVSLLSVAAPLPKTMFCVGIAMILFSDTLIALSRFLGQKRWNPLVCPTYFACHILIAASLMAEQGVFG